MKSFSVKLLFILPLLFLAGCKNQPIESFDVIVGQNTLTAQLSLSDDYALNIDASFPIMIKGDYYGHMFVTPKIGNSPFHLGLTADFSVFTSDVWDGFEPVTSLPNGDPLPHWIGPYELIRANIPNPSDIFDVSLYGTIDKPFYLGMTLSLNILDENYPEGLQVIQNFGKDGKNWGAVVLFGPTRDANGEIIEQGGIFFVVGVSALTASERVRLTPTDLEITGPDAHRYETPRAQQRLMRDIQRSIQDYNRNN